MTGARVPRIVATTSAEAPEADGRRQRSRDNRARIVEAMLELVHAGEPSPGAEQVADRAGVGLRTVFRHFRDMESLYGEMSEVIEAELGAIIAEPLTAADWRERVVELIHRRAIAFEKIGPFKRASNILRHGSPFLEAAAARFVSVARDILKAELPPEIAKDRLTFEALDMMLSFEAWNRLRRDQALTPRRAAEVLELSVRRLLG